MNPVQPWVRIATFPVLLSILVASALGQETQIQRLERLVASQPNHTGAIWYLAVLHTRAKDTAAAVKWLERLVKLDSGVDPETDREFQILAGSPGFEALVTEARKRRRRIANSRRAFLVPDKSLVPEGIAWDPASQRFFLGSIGKDKIVAVDRRGRVNDFVPAGRDGLTGVLGLRVDARTSTLWAISSRGGSSAVFAFDLNTGTTRGKYPMPGSSHQFNDLVVDKQGIVHITDSEAGAVFSLAPGSTEFKPLIAPGQITTPNGIAISSDGEDLFVAHFGGIKRIHLADMSVSDLTFDSTALPFGIDGLYFHKNCLIGIENLATPGRVVQYTLDRKRAHVTKSVVLEAGHPEFAIPTTGAIVGGKFYYIANSLVDVIDDTGKVTDAASLREPIVLVLDL